MRQQHMLMTCSVHLHRHDTYMNCPISLSNYKYDMIVHCLISAQIMLVMTNHI